MIKSKPPVFSRKFSVEGAADGRDRRPQKGDAVSDGSSLKGPGPPAGIHAKRGERSAAPFRSLSHPSARHSCKKQQIDYARKEEEKTEED